MKSLTATIARKSYRKIANVKESHVLTYPAPPEAYEYVNEHCEALIVAPQNSLRPGFFGKYLSRSVLKNRMKLPMIFISLAGGSSNRVKRPTSQSTTVLH